jgi:Protein of unknown function (DUF1566)
MTLPAARFVACAALFVLLIAVPARARAPAGHFTAAAGVVHDNKTNLNWQQAGSTATYTYANALLYCRGNVAALPRSGRRLPVIKELQTLVDDSVALPGPTIDASVFPSTPATYFWSSTPHSVDSGFIWLVSFDGGVTVHLNSLDTTVSFYVRCVR